MNAWRFLRVMSCAIVLLFIMIPHAAKSADEIIIYVDQAASGSANGQTWADAYTDLQVAIAAANANSQIWVAKGTYRPSTSDPSVSFTLKNDVGIYGGFAGNETLLSQRDWVVNRTILSGDLAKDDLSESQFDPNPLENIVGTNSFHVLSTTALSETALLDGFFITAGSATNTESQAHGMGAGMLNQNSSPTLRNLVFFGNIATEDGAAIANINSHPLIDNVEFVLNFAKEGRGGAIYNQNSNPVIQQSSFISNVAFEADGGAIYNDASNPIISNVDFIINETQQGNGGAIASVNGSDVQLDNVWFQENLTFYPTSNIPTLQGGAVSILQGKLTLNQVVFLNNNASGQVGGLFAYKSDVIADDVTFIESNQHYHEVTIASDESDVVLNNVTFRNSQLSPYNQGSLYLSNVRFEEGSDFSTSAAQNTLNNVIFADSSFNVFDSSAFFQNVLMYGSDGMDSGFSINNDNSTLDILNSTILGRTDSHFGASWNITNTFMLNRSIDNTSIWQARNSLVDGCKPGGVWDLDCGTDVLDSNLSDADPLFVSPPTIGLTTTINLSLQAASVGIDAGYTAAVSSTTDLAGNNRVNGSEVDLGAYEYYENQPIANAGSDQTVVKNSLVTLDASASQGETLQYTWRQIQGPPVTLSDANAAKPSFTSPTRNIAYLTPILQTLLPETIELVFELQVQNNLGTLSIPDRVTITVNAPFCLASEPTCAAQNTLQYVQYAPLIQHTSAP
jgi:hypothetical protein